MVATISNIIFRKCISSFITKPHKFLYTKWTYFVHNAVSFSACFPNCFKFHCWYIFFSDLANWMMLIIVLVFIFLNWYCLIFHFTFKPWFLCFEAAFFFFDCVNGRPCFSLSDLKSCANSFSNMFSYVYFFQWVWWYLRTIYCHFHVWCWVQFLPLVVKKWQNFSWVKSCLILLLK